MPTNYPRKKIYVSICFSRYLTLKLVAQEQNCDFQQWLLSRQAPAHQSLFCLC